MCIQSLCEPKPENHIVFWVIWDLTKNVWVASETTLPCFSTYQPELDPGLDPELDPSTLWQARKPEVPPTLTTTLWLVLHISMSLFLQKYYQGKRKANFLIFTVVTVHLHHVGTVLIITVHTIHFHHLIVHYKVDVLIIVYMTFILMLRSEHNPCVRSSSKVYHHSINLRSQFECTVWSIVLKI